MKILTVQCTNCKKIFPNGSLTSFPSEKRVKGRGSWIGIDLCKDCVHQREVKKGVEELLGI